MKNLIFITLAGMFGFHPLQAAEVNAFVEKIATIEEAQRVTLPKRLYVVSTLYTISYKDANGEYTKDFDFREGCEIFIDIDISISDKYISVNGIDANGGMLRQQFTITSLSSDENGGINSYVKYKARDSKGNTANITQIGIQEPNKIIVEYGNERRMYYVEIPDV